MAHRRPKTGAVGIYGVLILCVVALVALAIISRNWSCRQPKPPRIDNLGPFKVARVDGLNIVTEAGLGGRRERVIRPEHLLPPTDAEWLRVASDHVAAWVGSEVTVQRERRRIFSAAEPALKDNEPEAFGPIVGVVFGQSGINVNLELLRGGYADCDDGAPKEWQAARDAARKKRTGIWSKP